MGAKVSAIRSAVWRGLGLAAVAFASTSCADLKRLAPPGIVKYEDLEQGRPMNPAVAEAAAAERRDRDGFPNLSQQPQSPPAAPPLKERTATAAGLDAARDALAAAVAADRAAVAADRAATPDTD